MLTIGLFPNINKKNMNKVLAFVIEYLKKYDVRVIMPEQVAQDFNYLELAASKEQMLSDITLGITLGGDGTLLSTARKVAASNIPICGINMGRLGFLTEIELPDIELALEKLIKAEYSIEERLMLDAIVVRNGNNIYISSALNDVVVSRSGVSRMIRLELYVDNEATAHYSADGLIISTSTGSTGYSLSAGGPIVNPNLKVIVLTPICPHSLNTRSLIVADHEEIKINMPYPHKDIVLTIDGQNVYNLLPGDEVLVKCSEYKAKFIRLNGRSYYKTLRDKLWREKQDANF